MEFVWEPVKIKFNNKTAAFYQNTHDFEDFLGSMMVFSYCGLWIGLSPDKFGYFDTSYVFIVFCTSLITRMITFVIIHRTVSKINLQVNWKHLTIAVQSPARGALLLSYTLKYIVNDKFSFGRMMLVDNVILVCLSYIVNLALMGPVLGMIGMYDLTRAKIVNMNLAVSQVNECRTRAIQALKVDRVIADANWIVVEESTVLQHPYKKNAHAILEEEDEDFERKGQSRIVYCGECGAKGTAPLSKQEMEDVALDIKHRILKAQRVSFYRQHDNGTLSRHGVKVLSNLVEKVLVRDDPVLTAKDLKIQREGTARMQCLKKVFRHLFTVTSKKHAFIPTFWIRAFCFRFCTSRKYQITMACFSMIDLIFLLRLLHLHYGKYVDSQAEAKFLQVLDILFFSLFFFEFIVEVLGIGVVQYFYSPVNQVEFSCSCVIRTIELGMFINICEESDKFEDILQSDEIIFFLKTLLILRCTRVYIFILALIPKILNLVDKKMDEDLIKSYDIGKAYLITQEQVMKFLGHLVTNEEVFTSVSRVLESDRLIVAKELGLITFDRTTIATTNKTAHAIRNVVNSMTDCINSMKEEEYLDPLETTVLVGALEKVKNRARSLNLIEPLEPHLILTEIPWLKNDNSTLNFFLKHARVSSYCQDEMIINSGDDPCGLLIIIEGLAKVTYVPTVVSNDLNVKYGVLPNYDFFINLRFQLPQEEYITTNAVIGEIGIVTGRKYNMRVVCETSVHLMWFPMKILRAVIHEAGNHIVFQSALWKSIGIKIAVNLLQDCSQFRGWSREKLFMYLQGGVVPYLTGVTSVYIGDYVSDVILIEGIAMDQATRLLFVAPYYIPRTVASLLLPGSPMLDIKTNYATRLFIVPNFHSDAEDVSGADGLFKEYIQALERESGEKDNVGRSSSKILGRDAAECKKTHGRSKMSAYTRKVLKAQKKTLKAIRFMEYIPTVNGPIERNLTSTTFLMADKKRLISQAIYPKTRYYDPSFGYVGDVAENSEIREMKGAEEEEEDDRKSRRSGVPKRSTSRNLSSIGSISSSRSRTTVDMGSMGGKTHVEIHVIESSEDEIEKYESKDAQTSVQMAPKRKTSPSKTSVHSSLDITPN
uniref:Sodium/hydrogen exchanger 10 n=1 Tax=Lygus hesperus TaxID=30085 RepID=A0A0A9X444_LYGHE